MVNNLLKNGKALLLRRQTNILSAAFVIMLAYSASGILGLLRNRLLAAVFFGGLEYQLDVYFAAFVIPDTLFQLLITGSLSAAFIPVFSKYLKRSQTEALEMASSAMNVITLIFLLLVAVIFIFSPQLSRIIAPSLDLRNQLLLSQILKILIIAQIFFALSGFLTSIIQSHQRFLIPALSPIVYNLGIILGIIFLSKPLGIFGPTWGVVLGAFLHLVIQVPLAYKLGFRYSFKFNFNHPGVKKIRKLMPLRSLTLAVGQIERFIAVFIATSLSAGSLTIFNFARQLFLLPVSLFGTAISQASFPALSEEVALQKREEFENTVKNSILQVLYFSLPAAVIVLILRLPVVRIAFGARNFPWEATLLTSKTVALLSFAIPALSLSSLLTRAFYALHNTKTPLIIASLSAFLTTLLSWLFTSIFTLGVMGLALALSLSNFFQALVLLFTLNKRSKILSPELTFPASKMVLATLLTGVFLWLPLRVLDQFILDTTKTADLIILTASVLAIGMLVYLNLSAVLKIEQLKEVIALGKKIGSWQSVLESSEEVIEVKNVEQQVT